MHAAADLDAGRRRRGAGHAACRRRPAARTPLAIDASALTAFDTAALALLLQADAWPQAGGRAFRGARCAATLTQLAQLYGVAACSGWRRRLTVRTTRTAPLVQRWPVSPQGAGLSRGRWPRSCGERLATIGPTTSSGVRPALGWRRRPPFQETFHDATSPRCSCCRRAVCHRRPGPGRRPAQRHLLGAGRVVQHDPDGVRQDHRHQGQHVAQGLGRGAGAADRREGQPEDRRLVRRHRRPAPAGGRAGPDARVQVASLPQLHAWAQQQAQQSGYKTVGIYSGPAGLRLQHRAASRRRSCAVPKSWADLLKPDYKGEIQVANPASQRHRLHDGRHAGAADGRGQGLRLHEGAAQEHRPVHALAAPARSRPWRAARRRCRSASCTTARARRCRASRWRPSRRPKAPAPRSARCRSSRARATSTQAQEVLRMGADAAGAAVRRGAPSSSSCRRTRPRRSTRACPTSRRSSSSTTTTRSTAPAPSAGA